MGTMKIVYNNLIPFKGFNAINLFGVIFARKDAGMLSQRQLNHEAIHTAQMKELLYVFFYIFYMTEWIVKLPTHGRKAYGNISFEREAYEHDCEHNYLYSRKLYSWFKCFKLKK